MKTNSLLRYGFRPVLLSSVGKHKAFLFPSSHGTKTILENPEPFWGLIGYINNGEAKAGLSHNDHCAKGPLS